MENDVSMEIVEAGTTIPENQQADALQQDESFTTPTKNVKTDEPGAPTTPRRSPRVPKPVKYYNFESPDFRITPVSPRTPKSKITSTPKNDDESDVDIPDSPIMEVSSSDSFVVPSSIFKLSSPRKKGTPSKRTPSFSLNKSGPSPYKSHRPKYLPKNIKLYKKKGLERKEFLKKVEKFDAQLMEIPSLIANSKRAVNPVALNDGDLIGTKPHIAVLFHPEKFFVNFDEQSFDSKFQVSVAELVRTLSLKPLLVEAEDLRILCLFLSATSDKIAFDSAFLLVKENLNRVQYFLDWKDLKSILMNLGLTKEFYAYDRGAYSEFDSTKSPKIWNFEFVFWIVGHSFHNWMVGERLLRLVKFLSDILFDPMLQICQHKVILLLRRVAKYVLRNGDATVATLVPPLNHSHFSIIANRMIVQFLAPDPILKPLATALAFITIGEILQLDNKNRPNSFDCVANALADISRVSEKTSVKGVYQLIVMCECLVSMSARPFTPETKTFVGKLADFADQMSLAYSNFENLYFTDTVARLRTLSTIDDLVKC